MLPTGKATPGMTAPSVPRGSAAASRRSGLLEGQNSGSAISQIDAP